ncbi:MAG: IS607 family transposase [Chloroflexales bacterium]
MSTYTVRQFADRIGVSVKTLQRWDREGRLTPLRTPGNRRMYTDADIQQVLNLRSGNKHPLRKTIVYMRVSSQAQKLDLENQRRALEAFCSARGLTVDDWVVEIGGGLNFTRPKFLKLVDAVVAGDVETLVLAHKDRLARFGYELLSHLCETHQCAVLVLNQETLSPEQEMVQDLLAIVHGFSSRLDGLRTYRKVLKDALAYDPGVQDPAEPND